MATVVVFVVLLIMAKRGAAAQGGAGVNKLEMYRDKFGDRTEGLIDNVRQVMIRAMMARGGGGDGDDGSRWWWRWC